MFGISNLTKCNGRLASSIVDSGVGNWGWLEGSVYVDVDGEVVVDIDVDIYANVGNSRLGKMPRAPSVSA